MDEPAVYLRLQISSDVVAWVAVALGLVDLLARAEGSRLRLELDRRSVVSLVCLRRGVPDLVCARA